MSRRALAVLLGVALLLLQAAAVLAVGPAETHTERFKGVTETFTDVNPCTGDPADVTIIYQGVFHMTQLASGELHLTGTLTGTFALVPHDPSLPTYTGRFTQWFGENHNRNRAVATFTFSGRGTGSDGSTLKFHAVSHITADVIDFSTDPPTISGVTVAFDRFTCR